jgi:hypothetical protein
MPARDAVIGWDPPSAVVRGTNRSPRDGEPKSLVAGEAIGVPAS